MIETCSGLPRKSSAIFGYLWKFSDMFGNVRMTLGQVLDNLRESSQVVGNLRKFVKIAVISMSI